MIQFLVKHLKLARVLKMQVLKKQAEKTLLFSLPLVPFFSLILSSQFSNSLL